MELIRKSNGPINSDLWFGIFFYLINIKKIEVFFYKKTDWLQSELFLDCNGPRLVQN